MAEAASNAACEYDVAVVGGALSGAAAALLLKREDPDLRVLVIEKNEAFKRRVGEATVEVSGYFLCRVLGLSPGYWLRAQAAHDTEVASAELADELERIQPLVNC